MEEANLAGRLGGMSEELDELQPEQEDDAARGPGADVDSDDDSDVEGHLFQRR